MVDSYNQFFATFDLNNNGVIEPPEVRKLFKFIDKDGNGHAQRSEFDKVLNDNSFKFCFESAIFDENYGRKLEAVFPVWED